MNTNFSEKATVSMFTTEDVVCSYIYIYIYIYIHTHTGLTQPKTVILKHSSFNDHMLLVLQNTVIILYFSDRASSYNSGK
jgi:hypothetical protein